MNNEIIRQTMIESFEVIKDSWETKKDSIIRCIVETEACDGDLAMEMWAYELIHKDELSIDKKDNVHLVDDVILRFNEKFELQWRYSHNITKTILNHIAPYMVKNDTLIKCIFGNLYNAGYSGYNYGFEGNPSEILPACLACLFFQDNPHAVSVLIKALSYNMKMEDISIGELLLKSNFYIDGIINQWNGFDSNSCITDQVKESLLNCLDLIKDKNDRAEIALSIMAR